MSLDALNWAYKQQTGSSGTKSILVALANFADETGYCYPSQKTISRMTECPARSVRRYLARLEDDGFITRSQRRRDDGSYTSDGFYLSLKRSNVSVSSGQFGQRSNTPRPVAIQAASSGQSLTGHESSMNHQITVSTAPDERFSRWWSIYPNKKAKMAALHAWRTLKPGEELTAAMIEAVTKATKSDQWLRDGGRFIPHPSTWLNQRRWEDEGVAAAPKVAALTCRYVDKAGQICGMPNAKKDPCYGMQPFCAHHHDKIRERSTNSGPVIESLKSIVGLQASGEFNEN